MEHFFKTGYLCTGTGTGIVWKGLDSNPYTPYLDPQHLTNVKLNKSSFASYVSCLLQVDMLPEISIAPRMVTNFAALIKPSFKKDLDSYLKNRTPVSFLSELRTNLQVSQFFKNK